MTNRLVTANLALSLDGHYHGAGGPQDFAPFLPFVATDVARDQMSRIWESATTALLGRNSAEGFLGFWSTVADDENADARDRGYAKWLVDVEKVVLSSTLTEAPWAHARIANAPAAAVVADLQSTGTGDILVNSAPTVIKSLLADDLIDRLYLTVVPVITGGGSRLFETGLPATTWALTHHQTGPTGEQALTYDRIR
ncbi:dihydrofolate reductase family protein [Kribbella sp. NPDC056345]|uniref:dihydrofolate reductase family protein n=1 Tax=Kribbella sp. NPDC056345 TaxID=3345789 RepID=UPI0035DDF1B7